MDQSSFDANSSSTIKLNNGTVLYLREVNKFLALVCILREDNFDKQGLIDYNFNCFREAIQEVFETSKGGSTSGVTSGSKSRTNNPNHSSHSGQNTTLESARNGFGDI